jgi:YihY family inner membrane protein
VQLILRQIQHAAIELRADSRALGRYLLETEAHVYAFAIAANVLLAFFPFMLVIIALCRHVLHWPEAEKAIEFTLRDFFAGRTGDFLWYNLTVSAAYRRSFEWLSMLLLLFTANGVFLPLEVALNRAWGVTKNRSLLKNQVVSMALILSCGALALVSGALTGAGLEAWQALAGPESLAPDLLVRALAKIASFPITVLVLLLIYVYLPNTEVPWRLILPRAVVIGGVLELMKWLNLLLWSWIYQKFQREYGPFVNSVTILTWSFVAGLIVLAGAEWTARRARMAQESFPPLSPASGGTRAGAGTPVSR